MRNTYLDIAKRGSEWRLVVELREGDKLEFPLTQDGCRKAGAALRDMGIESWLCSSSLDFPREYDPSFQGNVHDLMVEGYQGQDHERDLLFDLLGGRPEQDPLFDLLG